MTSSVFKQRHRARRYALQALYSWLLTNAPIEQVQLDFMQQYRVKAFDQAYFTILLKNVSSHATALDALFKPYLKQPIDTLDPIELLVLRILSFELQEQKDIPYKVVLNEGLELAKIFGAEESHKFINGVADKLALLLRPDEYQKTK